MPVVALNLSSSSSAWRFRPSASSVIITIPLRVERVADLLVCHGGLQVKVLHQVAARTRA